MPQTSQVTELADFNLHLNPVHSLHDLIFLTLLLICCEIDSASSVHHNAAVLVGYVNFSNYCDCEVSLVNLGDPVHSLHEITSRAIVFCGRYFNL